ncbi:MAG: RNA polymerase sporulation sigma factor SigF [Clostridia bacterium]|nr:MAG: RNA polymerase sporulation sigma factor SigF [Clostridia bacterium]
MARKLSEMRLPRFPLLSEEETVNYLVKAKEGDREARDTLINCHIKLVFNLVKRFENRGCEVEDLFQIGTIGLIKAIDNFDLNHQVKFSTYAVPMIIGEIRRFLRDNGVIKVSRSVKETAIKVRQAEDMLAKEIGRDPTVGEIAETLGIPKEEVVAAMEAVQAPTSIHETFYQDDGDPIYVLDQLGNEAADESWLDGIAIKEVIDKLPTRLRQVLVLRYFEDQTQCQVAAQLGVSQVQVSRLEKQALQMARELLAEPEEEKAHSFPASGDNNPSENNSGGEDTCTSE